MVQLKVESSYNCSMLAEKIPKYIVWEQQKLYLLIK